MPKIKESTSLCLDDYVSEFGKDIHTTDGTNCKSCSIVLREKTIFHFSNIFQEKKI